VQKVVDSESATKKVIGRVIQWGKRSQIFRNVDEWRIHEGGCDVYGENDLMQTA
jgi:hypothetical protein